MVVVTVSTGTATVVVLTIVLNVVGFWAVTKSVVPFSIPVRSKPVVTRYTAVVKEVLLFSTGVPVVTVSAVVISGTVPVGRIKPVVTSGPVVVKKSRSKGVVESAVVISNAMVCVGSAEIWPTVRSLYKKSRKMSPFHRNNIFY